MKQFKSIVNVISAILILAISMPLLIVLALLSLITFKSVPVFIQTRAGKNGALFRMFKIRTMHENGEIPRVFKIVRKIGLDEMPQLINIIKGEMSFIGPRPLLPEYLEYYTERELKRHHVNPGITGWAQVNGRNILTWEEQFQYDLYYVDNMSIRLECIILLKTIITIFNGRNAQIRDKFSGS